jgi:hypothetical protein
MRVACGCLVVDHLFLSPGGDSGCALLQPIAERHS